MSMRFGRALLAATALSFLAVGGLHATAAMAAVPDGLGERADLVDTLPMSTDSGESMRSHADLGEIIWCSDPSGFWGRCPA